jgi:glycine/D-amino acid oxidase-like deaminating enzyme
MSYPEMARAFGLDTARKMHHIGEAAVDRVEQLVSEFDIRSARFERTGNLRCAHTERARRALEAEAGWLRDQLGDTSMSILSPGQVADETGSHAFTGGVLAKGAGTIRPLDYVRDLADGIAARHPQIIFENSPVLRVGREQNGIVLETPAAAVRADQVIIAANSYSGLTPATRQTRQMLIPFRSAIIATEPMPAELQRRLMVARRGYSETRRMMRWFRKVDGRMVFGGRGAFGKNDSQLAFASLRKAMVALFPDLRNVAVEYRWSGHVGMTLDKIPHVGRLDDRICFSAGYNGAGVAMSAMLGHYAALFAMGESPDVAILSASRARAIPFYGLRELGVRSVVGWYQLLDAVGL